MWESLKIACLNPGLKQRKANLGLTKQFYALTIWKFCNFSLTHILTLTALKLLLYISSVKALYFTFTQRQKRWLTLIHSFVIF